MNFLAHFYLTRGLEEITAGNFIADFVRSSEHHRFSEGVLKGIAIHRCIDTFTDEHPVVYESRKRLREKYRKYSVVITDVYYDHFLAVNWKVYSDSSLEKFSADTYFLLKKYEHIFPERAKYVFQYMTLNDWLSSYAQLEGISRALTGLSQRATFNSGMENAINDLQENYSEFEKEFTEFFPELQAYIKGLLFPSTKSDN